MAEVPMRQPRSRYLRCASEIAIAARRLEVWRALVHETSSWWPKDHYTGGETPSMVIEARVGGRVYEDWGQDTGVLWFHVVKLDPPRELSLAGHLLPGFGGPGIAYLELTLRDDGDDTRLSIRDSLVGGDDDTSAEAVAAGYEQIFGVGFKQYVEALATR